MATEFELPLPETDNTISAVQSDIAQSHSVQPNDEQLKNTQQKSAALFKIMRLKLPEVPIRRHDTHFLAWPREIRDMVYNYAMPKPKVRWDTRHRYFCKYRSQNGELEVPAFLTQTTMKGCLCNSCSHQDHREEKRRAPGLCVICGPRHAASVETLANTSFCDCTCAREYKSEGELNLRLVSRQVYSEVFLMFYERNVLCFNDGYQMVEYLHSLRPEIKNVIRQISLVGSSTRDMSSTDRNTHCGRTWGERVWDELESLPALRTLEIRPEHIKNGSRRMLEWIDNKEVTITMASFRSIQPVHHHYLKLSKAWVKVAQPLRNTDDAETVHREVWDFTSRIVGRAVDAAKHQLQFRAHWGDAIDDINPLDVGINPSSTERKKVVVWGLKCTTAMRVELVKEQRRDDAKRIANGQLTRREEAMIEQQKKLHQDKVLWLATKEKEQHEKELREAQEKELEEEKERELQEKKTQKKQKSKLKAEIRKAQETKQHERKRVHDA